MEAKQKAPSPIGWVLGQTGDHGGQYVLSVLLAVIGVAFSVAPYFVVTQIVKALMAGNRELGFYLTRCAVMAALWLGRVLCHALFHIRQPQGDLCRAGGDPQEVHGKADAHAFGYGAGAELRRVKEYTH